MAEIDGKPGGHVHHAAEPERGASRTSAASSCRLGIFKLLYRIKVNHPKSTRLMMLGIRKEVTKNMKRYGGLSAAMYVEVAKRGIAKGYEWGELSWTREDDKPINLGIRSMGAEALQEVPRLHEGAGRSGRDAARSRVRRRLPLRPRRPPHRRDPRDRRATRASCACACRRTTSCR